MATVLALLAGLSTLAAGAFWACCYAGREDSDDFELHFLDAERPHLPLGATSRELRDLHGGNE